MDVTFVVLVSVSMWEHVELVVEFVPVVVLVLLSGRVITNEVVTGEAPEEVGVKVVTIVVV